MKRHDRRVIAVSWLLALTVPLVSASGSWLWADVTTTAHQCATGAGGGYGSLVVFLLLALAAPVAVVWQGRRAGRSVAEALAPAFGSAALGFVLVYLGFEFWWTGHDCMT